jgi:hypothetical protein
MALNQIQAEAGEAPSPLNQPQRSLPLSLAVSHCLSCMHTRTGWTSCANPEAQAPSLLLHSQAPLRPAS